MGYRNHTTKDRSEQLYQEVPRVRCDDLAVIRAKEEASPSCCIGSIGLRLMETSSNASVAQWCSRSVDNEVVVVNKLRMVPDPSLLKTYQNNVGSIKLSEQHRQPAGSSEAPVLLHLCSSASEHYH